MYTQEMVSCSQSVLSYCYNVASNVLQTAINHYREALLYSESESVTERIPTSNLKV